MVQTSFKLLEVAVALEYAFALANADPLRQNVWLEFLLNDFEIDDNCVREKKEPTT